MLFHGGLFLHVEVYSVNCMRVVAIYCCCFTRNCPLDFIER